MEPKGDPDPIGYFKKGWGLGKFIAGEISRQREEQSMVKRFICMGLYRWRWTWNGTPTPNFFLLGGGVALNFFGSSFVSY